MLIKNASTVFFSKTLDNNNPLYFYLVIQKAKSLH